MAVYTTLKGKVIFDIINVRIWSYVEMSDKLTILYVEDENDIRENTMRPLKRLCDELITASDGKEGLELYKKYKPDIVISDINMPNMNGIEMSKAIKAINSEQPIVFTTAHSDSSYFMDAIEMQVDGYILKPIDYDLLKQKVHTITNQINIKNRLKEQEIINSEIAIFQDNLLFIMDNKETIFANKKFLDFFNVKTIEDFNNKHDDVSSCFLKNSGCFYPKHDRYWIDDLMRTKDEKRRVVALKARNNETHVFVVTFNFIEESEHTVFIFTEITNLNNEKNFLKENVYSDALTKVPNRLYFDKQIYNNILKVESDKSQLSLIIIDIDKFKDFNDTYGHLVGDNLLFELANYIVDNKRQTDIFARWGGEEFMMLLPNTSFEKTKEVAEKLRQSIEEHLFCNGLKMTCSFGLAEFTVFDTKESFIKRADDALYVAKKSGRNRVEFEV